MPRRKSRVQYCPCHSISPHGSPGNRQASQRPHLEWGEIARVAVTDRKLLRELGFLNAKRPVAQEDDAEEEEKPLIPVALQA